MFSTCLDFSIFSKIFVYNINKQEIQLSIFVNNISLFTGCKGNLFAKRREIIVLKKTKSKTMKITSVNSLGGWTMLLKIMVYFSSLGTNVCSYVRIRNSYWNILI